MTDRRWKSLHLKQDGWQWRKHRGKLAFRSPRSTVFHVAIPEVTGEWDEDHSRRAQGTEWTGIPSRFLRAYLYDHLIDETPLEMPPLVFLHRHRTVERYAGAASRWHMFWDCKFLARYRGTGDFVERYSVPKAVELLGAPLTRANLCGPCMRFMKKQQREQESHD